MVEPLVSVATVFVYCRRPKLARLLRSDACTIHSTSCWHNGVVEVTVCVALWPVVLFLIVTVPDVLDFVVTVTVTEWPVLIEGPDMTTGLAGAHM
jgi:hypothetical protein